MKELRMKELLDKINCDYNMEDLKQKLDEINKILEKYCIDPITEEDIIQVWEEALQPGDPCEVHGALDEFWQNIREYKSKFGTESIE